MVLNLSLNLSESPRSGGAWVSEVAEVAHHALVAQCLEPKDWATTNWWANMEVETHIIPVILGFSIINHPALGVLWFSHSWCHPWSSHSCAALSLNQKMHGLQESGWSLLPNEARSPGLDLWNPVSSGVVEKFGKSLKNALVFTGKIVDFPATLMTPEVFCALEPGLPAISWETDTDRIPTCFITGDHQAREVRWGHPQPNDVVVPK